MQTPQIQQMYRVCFTSAITLILVLLKVQENLSLQRNHFKWNQFSEKFSNLYMASPTFLQKSVMLFFILRKKNCFSQISDIHSHLQIIFYAKRFPIQRAPRFWPHHVSSSRFIQFFAIKIYEIMSSEFFFMPVDNLITFLMDFGEENEK